MAVRMIPSTRYGVYMGIMNMMIVVPMLIQTVTFGPILQNVLGDDPGNAITFAGVLLAVAAVAERAADLIVVGALRDTSIADRLLGSVATEVVRRAGCDVLVVRPRPDPGRQPAAGEPAAG
jgi:hypothetical protein